MNRRLSQSGLYAKGRPEGAGSEGSKGHRLLACAMLALTLLAPGVRGQLPTGSEDHRQAYGPTAPTWLRAVGQLQVPGSRYREGSHHHHREDCSATLVARRPGGSADTIVTAWHCLESYRDLSRPITFTLLAGTGDGFTREALRLSDGGGMHADWAILRLRKPVPRTLVQAMAIHPHQADPAREISMAGYSRDAGIGRNGERLTFDPACRITSQTPTGSDSDCAAHKGASGGAVVQLSPTGVAQFSGVISAGDGAGTSLFVPVASFRRALYRQLR